MKIEQRINVRAKPELVAELNEVAKVLEIPASQLARQAIREKIAELKRTNPLLQETNLTAEQIAKHAARMETV